MIEPLTDVVEGGVDLVLEQYRGKPRYEAFLAALLRPVQVLENDIHEVILGRMLDNAIGQQLRDLGDLVGEPWTGRPDDEYRLFVKARIARNRSHGRPNDVIRVLRIVEATPFKYSEAYPATIVIEYLGTPDADPNILYELAYGARSGGVALVLTYGAEDFFCNCAGTDDVVDVARGAAPVDLSTGGYMSALVSP
jgi:hypothetical protein